MGYYDNNDINSMIGNNPLNSDDDDVTSALNGEYDDIMDDTSLESLMDADGDLSDIGDFEYSEEELARTIAEESQGVDEEGQPCAAISLSIEMVNADLTQRRTISQHAMFRPVLTINPRDEFIELLLTFPSAIDSNIKVTMFNLDKYNQLLQEMTQSSVECPVLTFVIVPTSGLGCYYMSAMHPLFWALHSEKAGDQPKQIKVLFKAEDVNFFQTDEIDMVAIEAERQREIANEEAAYDYMEAKEKEIRQKEYVDDLFAFMSSNNEEDNEEDNEEE